MPQFPSSSTAISFTLPPPPFKLLPLPLILVSTITLGIAYIVKTILNDPNAFFRNLAENGYSHLLPLLKRMSTVDVNSQDEDGQTALHQAARSGHVAAVRVLCGMEADSSLTESRIHETPLHYAAVGGNLDVVRTLLANGAIPQRNLLLEYPMHLCARYGNHQLIETLANAQDPHEAIQMRSHNGWTPMHEAAKNGRLEVMKTLHHLGANINTPDINGFTPFHIAVKYKQVQSVQALHALGANMYLNTNLELSAIHLAQEANDTTMIRALFDLSFNLDRVSRLPILLYNAAKKGQCGILKLLICRGHLNPDLQLHDQRTALHTAILNEQIDAVKLLLSLNASTLLRDRSHFNAHDLAQHTHNQALIDTLAINIS